MSYAGHYWTPATRDGHLKQPPSDGWWYCIQCGMFGAGEGGFCPKYGDLERSERDIAWRREIEPLLKDLVFRIQHGRFPMHWDAGRSCWTNSMLERLQELLREEEDMTIRWDMKVGKLARDYLDEHGLDVSVAEVVNAIDMQLDEQDRRDAVHDRILDTVQRVGKARRE